MDSICLRPFISTDADDVEAVIYTTIDTIYADVYPPSVMTFFKDFHTAGEILKRAETGCVLVAETDGKVIGTGASVDNRIFGMFVRPEFQGHGIGKRLMAALESSIQSDGHTAAVLSMSLPSQAFYTRLGYREYETYSKTMPDGEELVFADAAKQL